MSKGSRALLGLFIFLMVIIGSQFIGSSFFDVSFSPAFGIFLILLFLGTILFPHTVEFPRAAVAGLWALIYAVGRVPLTLIQPTYHSGDWVMVGLEICLLTVAVILVCHLVEILQSFEVYQDKLFRPSPNVRIKHIKSNLEEINAEFTRCRRYNHTLSIVAVEPARGSIEAQQQTAQKSQKLLMRKFITLNLAEVLSRQIRQFDMILIKEWNGRFYILCPENTAEGSEKLGQRINRITESSMGIAVDVAWVLFPKDALTLEEMINQADHKLDVIHAFNTDHSPLYQSENKQLAHAEAQPTVSNQK
jgi:hypothetical protein